MIYQWSRQGRRPATVWAVVLVLAAATGLWLFFDAAWFVVTLVATFSAPALYDLWRNPQSDLEVWPNRVAWTSPLKSGDRRDIDHVRLDRRFDGSMKITLIHVGGTHTRLPPDITPPTQALENALESAAIGHQRHPFTPF